MNCRDVTGSDRAMYQQFQHSSPTRVNIFSRYCSLIFEILNDFLAQHVGIGEIVGFFEAFVSEAEDVEAGFVAIMR